ncbi:cysteine hydrolase family protein [Tautonia rosea]|uniref:cysteine hydrolase family protein n=1 Tax=Tautonia rosea TaxID=2728037 RepID=UPI0014732E20
MKTALLVIDVQNDYFPGGKFPLWKPEATLQSIEHAIAKAKSVGIPVIFVQHVVTPAASAPFFGEGTEGAAIHPRIQAAAPDAPIVVKQSADSFRDTTLDDTLQQLGITDLLVCGMMTHNCVTHTALSKAAEKYHVRILPDCCTTVDEMIHALSLSALSDRLPLVPSDQALEG